MKDLTTRQLTDELMRRRAALRAELAGIDTALGERNNFQLADARLALDVAMAVCAETNVDDPICLFAHSRALQYTTPRRLLHWILRKRHGWSLERIGLHCERDHSSILQSVASIDACLGTYSKILERITGRLAA